jgi:hypothetical protein
MAVRVRAYRIALLIDKTISTRTRTTRSPYSFPLIHTSMTRCCYWMHPVIPTSSNREGWPSHCIQEQLPACFFPSTGCPLVGPGGPCPNLAFHLLPPIYLIHFPLTHQATNWKDVLGVTLWRLPTVSHVGHPILSPAPACQGQLHWSERGTVTKGSQRGSSMCYLQLWEFGKFSNFSMSSLQNEGRVISRLQSGGDWESLKQDENTLL